VKITQEDVMEWIGNLKVMELTEFIRALEEKFHVAPMAQQAVQIQPEEAKEEKTEFDVILKGFGEGKKISTVKEIRAVTTLGLKEAKDFVEACEKEPKAVKEGIPREEAEKVKTILEAAGAEIDIR